MKHIISNERGQTLIEYTLILVIVVLAIILVYTMTVSNAILESLLKIADIIRNG